MHCLRGRGVPVVQEGVHSRDEGATALPALLHGVHNRHQQLQPVGRLHHPHGQVMQTEARVRLPKLRLELWI